MQVDVARCGLFDFDVAAARASAHRTCDLARLHISRSCLYMNLSGKPRELHVPWPTLQVGIAANIVNRLIARAGAGVQHSIGGYGDFVVHGDIANVYVIDADAVAILTQRRMLFDFGHIRLPVTSEQPAVAHEDLTVNGNRA